MDHCKIKKWIHVLSISLFSLSIPFFAMIGYLDHALPDLYREGDSALFSIASRPYLQAESMPAGQSGAPVSVARTNAEVLRLKLFGIFPIKSVTVQQTQTVMLAPCGTPFGIKMVTDGVLVVGMSNLETQQGSVNPAKDAGLEIGDVLCSLDGQPVQSNEDVSRIISDCGGRQVECVYRRDGVTHTTWLTPMQSLAGSAYRIGIWVRDSTAGIGTLTYCDFSQGTFAGLGHGVCDVDTGELMPLMSGEIVGVTINEIVKGQAGTPGELRGVFHEENRIGTLTANRDTGVFGDLLLDSANPYLLPMAFRQQVQEGAAQILTTIDGNTPQLFDITIEKISFAQDTPTKNMIIRITDPDLLAQTGGIVQGMSGSPILQNGMLVGAVTHVFVNDPTKGYGIFAENMYFDAAS